MLFLSTQEPTQGRDIGNLPIGSAKFNKEFKTFGRDLGLTGIWNEDRSRIRKASRRIVLSIFLNPIQRSGGRVVLGDLLKVLLDLLFSTERLEDLFKEFSDGDIPFAHDLHSAILNEASAIKLDGTR